MPFILSLCFEDRDQKNVTTYKPLETSKHTKSQYFQLHKVILLPKKEFLMQNDTQFSQDEM